MRIGQLVVLGLGVLLTSARVAGDESLAGGPEERAARRAQDQRVRDVLVGVLDEGARLYNGGETTASAYLFQGSAQTLLPLLDYRPDLQRSLRRRLEVARALPSTDCRAWALREVLVEVRTAVTPPPIRTGEGETVWERLGGEANVRRIVDDFIDGALADPRVDLTRGGKYPMGKTQLATLKESIVQLTSHTLGGPYRYQGRSLKTVHKGMGITEDEYEAFLGHLTRAMPRHGVRPKDARAVLEEIQVVHDLIVAPKVAAAKPEPPDTGTLWERLGGEAAVARIVDDFVEAALKDPKVNFTRGGKFDMSPAKVEAFKRSLVVMTSSVTGGPLRYEGRTMKQIHQGMKITEAEFDALIDHLRAALQKHQVKPDVLRQIIEAIENTRGNVVGSPATEAPAPRREPVGAGAGAPAPAVRSEPPGAGGSAMSWPLFVLRLFAPPGKSAPRVRQASPVEVADPIPPPSAAVLLNRAVEALGGEGALSRLKAGSWTGRASRGAGGGPSVDLECVWLGERRARLTTAGVMDFSLVVGDGRWWLRKQDEDQGVTRDSWALAVDGLFALRLPHLLPALREPGVRFGPVASYLVDDRPAFRLPVRRDRHADMDVYLDRDDSLPLGADVRLVDAAGQAHRFSVRFHGYRDFDGLRHFARVRVEFDDRQYTAELARVRPLSGGIDPRLFERP